MEIENFEIDMSNLDDNSPSQTENELEERYNYLCENDRIYRALKFKKRKGFFRHILPALWIMTLGFYGLLAFTFMCVLTLIVTLIPPINRVIFLLLFYLIPIALLVFGITKRVKYIKEKKLWKECTDSGKKDIKEVFKEFQEIEKEYLGI